MYPKQFNRLISTLEQLPGVGEKTAQRYAFSLLEKEPEDIADFILTLQELKQIRRCKTCGFLSEEEECQFCVDPSRDRRKIMVLAYPQDVVAMEKTASYNGLYHVLNGLISSTKGIFPEDINIEGLLKRITQETDEIIIAVSPTMDGEMTSLYLNKILSEKNILITRLAHGLPMGSSLDYADELTLIKALNNRRKIENE
ncbi:MAG: recombination protein RecR [Erysipelotrichaceae bacterium]|nr:recombination protein RecR [Erysipelotrichaceae bacterium]